MAKRKVKKLLPTLKVKSKSETDIQFTKPVKAVIVAVEDLETKHGDKVVGRMENKEMGNFNVFINNNSMEKLIEAYGDDDVEFIGNVVEIRKEYDKHFDSEMLVMYPVKA